MLVEVISSNRETNTILNARVSQIGKSVGDVCIGRVVMSYSGNVGMILIVDCVRVLDVTSLKVDIRSGTTLGSHILMWKGCHIHSNIFIRLVSCYLCVSYLLASVIIINLLCYSDLNLDITIRTTLPIQTYPTLTLVLLYLVLLFSSCSLLSELDCNRDSIREYS